MISFLFRQPAGHSQGLDHAAGLGLRRQAMSKAVPWATLVRMIGSPSVTFTARCIPSNFKRDVPLVVVHGHHGVESSVAGVDHQRVGRQRPFERHALRPGRARRPAG